MEWFWINKVRIPITSVDWLYSNVQWCWHILVNSINKKDHSHVTFTVTLTLLLSFRNNFTRFGSVDYLEHNTECNQPFKFSWIVMTHVIWQPNQSISLCLPLSYRYRLVLQRHFNIHGDYLLTDQSMHIPMKIHLPLFAMVSHGKSSTWLTSKCGWCARNKAISLFSHFKIMISVISCPKQNTNLQIP